MQQGMAVDFESKREIVRVPMDVSNLLRELKNEGKIIRHGSKNQGFWTLPIHSTN
jgi:hypothetical protein